LRKIIVGVLLAVCFVAFIYGITRNTKNELNQYSSGGKVGVIYLEGPIVGGRGSGGLWGDPMGTDTLIRYIRKAREDNEVKAVVLRMNTPGGSAAASQEVAEEIARLQMAGKVVVTSMGDVATSGGYWIAAGTDRIVANPATTTGSIGVIWSMANMQELFRKVGVEQDTIKSGPYKDIGSPARPMTPEEKALLQGMIDDIYGQFVAVVAKGRKMDEQKVRSLADGRIYTGRQAKELGLVDELGDMYDAISMAAEMAGLDKEHPAIKEYGRTSPLEKLLGDQRTGTQLGKLNWSSLLPEILPDIIY